MDLLKAANSMQPKEQEFIDHTLLAPEYIRETSSYVMDFIETPVIYAKNLAHANGVDNEYAEKEALQLHNSIYQLMQKHVQESMHEPETALLSSNAVLLTLSGEAQQKQPTRRARKPRSARKQAEHAAGAPAALPQQAESMAQGAAKKTLPHKKRIARKLKSPECGNKDALNVCQQRFSCELCAYATATQLEFYSHLKQHYEPAGTDNILATLDAPGGEVPVPVLSCAAAEQDKFAEVLQLHYDDFSAVQQAASVKAELLISTTNEEELLKAGLGASSASGESHLKHSAADEAIEFSDTEDMLEGIRNVVDKVSIEDTCDNLELMESNGMRAQWFNSNNNFQDNDAASFAGQLQQLLSADANAMQADDDSLATELRHGNDVQQADEHDVNAKAAADAEEYPFVKRYRARKARERSTTPDDTDVVLKRIKHRYTCQKCQRQYSSNNALKYHESTHTGLRPYPCNYCMKSFMTPGALKSHITTHTGDRPFKCEQCERTFRLWGDLKCHIKSIHCDEKSYQCEYCGKSFARRYSLVLHRRIHTSERNYKCEFCEKTFRASIYLQNHRKVHTGEKPFACPMCPKSFRVSGDLSRHKRMHERRKQKQQPTSDITANS